MAPEHIELFIDRICGYFPTTNIARNTVKSAWRQEDMLLDLSEEDGKKALALIQNEPQFPTLSRVKQIIRTINRPDFQGYCGKCEAGWIYVGYDKIDERKYPVVARCKCSGGKHESRMGMQEVFNFVEDVRAS